MNLLLNQLRKGIADLADRMQVTGYRVEWKRNRRGELVIALIISDDGRGPLSKLSLGE